MTSTNRATSSTGSFEKWLERGLFVALLLACALAMSHAHADPDFWGHVQYGRDVLREGLPDTATYSYTANGHRWINHENISELFMAVGVNTPGPTGLLVIKCLLGLLLMTLIYRQASRQGVDQAPIYITMLLVACNLMHSWTLRPQLLTYVFFALMIALLEWCFAPWRSCWRTVVHADPNAQSDDRVLFEQRRRLRWLWLLPPMFLIWANGHGGFIAGYCILGAYLGGRGLEALMQYGRRGVGIVATLAVVLALTGLITLVNPYGLELPRWLLHSLGEPRPEVLEWLPPKFLSVIWPTWWLMVALFVLAIFASRRPRDLTHLVILGLTLWQACEHRRHIAFFAILFGFWMPIHIESLLARMRGNQSKEVQPARLTHRKRWAVGVVLTGLICLMCFNLFNQVKSIPVRRDSYPVSAFQYITDQNLSGNLILRFKWAQYAIAAFGDPNGDCPHLKVAFDGRFRTCYPQEIVDMYFDFAIGDAPPELRHRSPNSPPVDGSRILKHHDPDLVLIDREQTYSVKIMQENRDAWTLLYQDSLAQLWGRSDTYGNPNHADYVPPSERSVSEKRQEGIVAWPALPTRRPADVQLAEVDRL